MKDRVLLVEDDPNLGMILQEFLSLKGGFDVTLCRNGEEGLKEFSKGHYDLCILDVMMPRMDGFTLAKELRKINAEVPIIFATAKGMLEDKKEGFASGADDYITKPFSIEELQLRIDALMKRTRTGKNAQVRIFRIGNYEFDYPSHMLKLGDKQQKITSKEADLLRLLCIHINEVVSREEALLKIWKDDSYFAGRSMDVFLTKLRKYLKEDSRVEIVNIHGKGFKLVVNER